MEPASALSAGRERTIPFADVPFESFGALISALCGFREGRPKTTARLHSEPELDLTVDAGMKAGDLCLEVVRVADGRGTHDHEMLFAYEGDALAVARTFWRALRRVVSQFDPVQWRYGFPSKDLTALGELTMTRRGDPGNP